MLHIEWNTTMQLNNVKYMTLYLGIAKRIQHQIMDL